MLWSSLEAFLMKSFLQEAFPLQIEKVAIMNGVKNQFLLFSHPFAFSKVIENSTNRQLSRIWSI